MVESSAVYLVEKLDVLMVEDEAGVMVSRPVVAKENKRVGYWEYF